MDTDINGQSPQAEISAHVASCVIRVSDLDRSLAFTATYSPAGWSSVNPIRRCC
jgi:hypothetical protein